MELSKKHEIYEAIREEIIARELEPGSIINEGVLAKKHGVSRTPVREALLMLAVENLVNPLPRAGYMVTKLSIQDVQESFHLRELLEGEAARLTAVRITEAQIAHLRDVEIGVPPRIEEMNRDFHLTIASASGSERLYKLIVQLIDDVKRILAYDPYMIDPPQSYRGHREIIEALADRDPDRACHVMRRHISDAKTRVLERF